VRVQFTASKLSFSAPRPASPVGAVIVTCPIPFKITKFYTAIIVSVLKNRPPHPEGLKVLPIEREPGVRIDKPHKIGAVRFDNVAIEAEPEADDEQRRQRNPAGPAGRDLFGYLRSLIPSTTRRRRCIIA
jgi:hypothetical protein